MRTVLVLLCVAAATMAAQPQIITPGDVWPDNRGQHIKAHGGGIIKLGTTYYYEEPRARDRPGRRRL